MTLINANIPRRGLEPQFIALLISSLSLFGTIAQVRAQANGVVYDFKGGPSDGAAPNSLLTRSVSGVFYGTKNSGGRFGNGTVFQLSPPAELGGKWVETVIFDFPGGHGGRLPRGGVILDTAGSLYGVTALGGDTDHGAVYQLTPRADGGAPWDETVLYSFGALPNDGMNPSAG